MAAFNPETPFNVPDVSKRSRGQVADTSLGTLFSGAGKLLEGSVAVAEQRTKRQITSDVQQERQEIDQDFNVPPAVSQSATSLRTLTQQFKQGLIDERLYHLRAGQITKSIRLKYPNWRRFVDDTIAKEMGFDPANAIRQDAFEAFKKEQTSKDILQNTMLRQLLSESGQEIMSLNPDIAKDVHEGNIQQGFDKMVAAREEKASFDREMRKIGLEAKGREDLERRTSSAVNTLLPRRLNSMLSSTIKVLGDGTEASGWVGLQRIMSGVGADSAEQIQQVWSQIEELRTGMESVVEQYGNTAVDPSKPDGQTVRDVLGPTKFAELKAQHLAPMDRLIKTQGLRDSEGRAQFNAISGAAALMKLQDSQLAQKIRENNPSLKFLAGLEKATGSDNFATLLTTTPEFANEIGKAYTAIFKAFTEQPAKGPPKDDTENANDAITGSTNDTQPVLTPDEVQTRLNLWTEILEGNITNMEEKKNFFSNMFSTNSVRLFNEFKQLGLTRQKVLVQMASPDVSKIAVQFKGTKTYNNYKNFMIEGAFMMQDVRDVVGNLNTTAQRQMDRHLGNLTFDVQTGRWDAGPRQQPAGTEVGGVDEPGQIAYHNAVDRMNVIMSLFDTLAEAEGKDKGIFYDEVFRSWKVKFPDEEQTNLVKRMWEAAQEANSAENVGKAPSRFGVNPEPTLEEELQDQERVSGSSFSPDEDAEILTELISFDAEDNVQLTGDASDIASALDIGETGGTGDYDTILSNAQDTYFPEGLTNTSVEDVLAVQSKRGKGSMLQELGLNSTAVGRFQIVGKTLKGLVNKLDIDKTEKFDKTLQDKLFKELLKQRGFEKFAKGDMSLNQFIKNMGQEWEGFLKNKRARRRLAAVLLSIGVDKETPKPRPSTNIKKKVESEPLIPVNMKTFVTSLFGDKTDITEKDFSVKDKQAIRRAVDRQFSKTGKRVGVIGYGDYGKEEGTFSSFGQHPGLFTLIMDSFTDSKMRLETTLGMARYEIQEDGVIKITDTYDFGASKERVEKLKKDKKVLQKMFEGFRDHGIEGLLNILGNLFVERDARKVKIHLE